MVISKVVGKCQIQQILPYAMLKFVVLKLLYIENRFSCFTFLIK